jgi:lipid II:glycine glycyltransferase (peptidoglycan interpeptide bridge formation enzyme)
MVMNMLEVDNSRFIFKTKKIWFSEVPFDVTGYDGVTFFECTRDVDVKGFSKEEFTTIVIDLTQDLETIWERMHKNSCRRLINKAIKEGVVIRVNQDYDTFFDMHSEFRKSKGLSEYNIDIEFMKKNGTLFVSEFEGNIIGGIFCLSDDKNFRAMIGGSRRLEENVIIHRLSGVANRLVIWEAIKYAKEMGIVNFDMGGYYTGKEPDPQKEGINKFKSSFGGQVLTHYIYQKDYSIVYFCARKILSIKYIFRNFFMKYHSNSH